MKYHFRNLVFEGGGVKGVAYIGALEVLEEKGILQNIKRVGGASAGAIAALLLALEYTVSDISDILKSMNLKKLLDSSWGVLRNTERLLREYGWYKGEFFKDWIGDLIERKTGNRYITFGELEALKRSRELYLIGTNISTGFAEVFSYKHTPDISLIDAIRISMSIPFFFTAVRMNNKNVCVDGGVLDNYPIKLFDRKSFIDSYYKETNYYDEINSSYRLNNNDIYVFNMETLGFRLDSSAEIKVFEHKEPPKVHEIKDFYEYVRRLVATLMDSQQNRHLHSDDWQRTVYIDTLGVKTTDFDISDEMKNKLIASGRVGTNKYLEWFHNAKEDIANRPSRIYDVID